MKIRFEFEYYQEQFNSFRPTLRYPCIASLVIDCIGAFYKQEEKVVISGYGNNKQEALIDLKTKVNIEIINLINNELNSTSNSDYMNLKGE